MKGMGYVCRMVKRFLAAVVFFGLVGAGWAQSLRPGMGAIPYADGGGTGVTFRLWAGSATTVEVAGDFNGWNPSAHPLVLEADGIWSLDVPGARAGQQYKYRMNQSVWRRDPRSARVVHAGNTDSIIYDHQAYAWQSGPFTPPPLNEMVIYELHVGTFNDPNPAVGGSASLDDARERLDYLAGLGINAVKIMPITEFPGSHSWGYNPTDLFAVDNLTYGGPDALKRFVDAAHQRGIAVLLDIVHNHYGTADLPGDLQFSLWEFDGLPGALGGGMYFYQQPALAMTRWGPRPDYSRPHVRDFIKDNARMWLRDYRIDGFRWDATKYMRLATNDTTVINDGVSLIRQINDIIRTEFTNKVSIAEDLEQLPSTTAPTPGGLGYHSDWHTEFHHAVTEELAKSAGFNTNRVVNAIRFTNHTRRVIYTESHDEVGHPYNNQIRVPAEMDPLNPGSHRARKRSILAAGWLMTSPGIPMLFQGQEFLTPTHFYDTNSINWNLTNTYAGILRFYQDAVRLRRNANGGVGGLTGAVVQVQTEALVFTNVSLITMHRRNQGGVGDDVFVVANPSDARIDGDWLTWPATGMWYAVLNSDDARYSADFGGHGYTNAFVFEDFRGPIAIAPWSIMVFSRVPPPTDYTGMALAGTYNNWNPAANMTRLGGHDWQLDLALAETPAFVFKFTANSDWVINNWGTGTVSSAGWPRQGTAVPWGGDFSIPIPTADTYRFTFNSATGRFQVRHLTPVPRGQNHPTMAVAGNFNNFNRTPNMGIGTNGLWTFTAVLTQPWDLEFKLAAYGSWEVSWGGTGLPGSATGKAIKGASENIRIPGPFNGAYTFTFDDTTGAFSVEQTGLPPPYAGMAVGGNFNGWRTAPNMASNDLHVWSFTTNISQGHALEFKFAANNTGWNTSWSRSYVHANQFPVAGIAARGENNNIVIQGPHAGTYTFTFNSATLEYTVQRAGPVFSGMAVAGSHNGWAFTPNMTSNGLHQWTYTTNLNRAADIEFKFVANNDWNRNWGKQIIHPPVYPLGDTAEYLATNNIRLQGPFLGSYTFTFNSSNGTYAITRAPLPPLFPAMAVAGTHNGWNTEPNMQTNHENEWVHDVELNQPGELQFKFSTPGWTNNWGDAKVHGATFPATGTGVTAGANIRLPGPLAGTYRFTFNDRNRSYRVEQLAAPFFLSLPAAMPPAGPAVLQWNSATGAYYTVHVSTNLMQGFTPVASNLPAGAGFTTWTSAVPASAPSVFYRIQQQ